MTAALLNLATYTEYIQHLREEIEAALEEFGWTKAGMGKMVKLDSFLKESMRMNTLSFRKFSHLVDQTGIIVFLKWRQLEKLLKSLHSQMEYECPAEHSSLLLLMLSIMMKSVFRAYLDLRLLIERP